MNVQKGYYVRHDIKIWQKENQVHLKKKGGEYEIKEICCKCIYFSDLRERRPSP